MATYDRCEWCQQPKGADVHPTHFTQTQCIDVLKVEMRKAEEAGIDAIRAVTAKLAEVTAERDRYRTALEHYADPATFCPFTGYYLPKGWDGCKVARAALAAAREAGSVSTGAGGGPEVTEMGNEQ